MPRRVLLMQPARYWLCSASHCLCCNMASSGRDQIFLEQLALSAAHFPSRSLCNYTTSFALQRHLETLKVCVGLAQNSVGALVRAATSFLAKKLLSPNKEAGYSTGVNSIENPASSLEMDAILVHESRCDLLAQFKVSKLNRHRKAIPSDAYIKSVVASERLSVSSYRHPLAEHYKTVAFEPRSRTDRAHQ